MKKYIFLAAILCLSVSIYAGTPISAQERAMYHFNTHYEKSDNAIWVSKGNKSIYCYLKKVDISIRAFYDGHGDWLYTLRSYPPSYLPAHLQQIILSLYKGFSMDYVNEIDSDNDPVYTIHIQSDRRIEIVRLMSDGSDEVIESIRKQ